MRGDALADCDQVMDNGGLLIAGASIAAGVVLGRMRFPDLESFRHSGARGAVSGGLSSPDLTGGPVENSTIDGVTISREGTTIVEKHIFRFDHDPANDVMVSRLKKIASKELLPEKYDPNYYTHECRGYQRYCNLGWETGEPNGLGGYGLWNNAHTAALEDFRIKDTGLFRPDAER